MARSQPELRMGTMRKNGTDARESFLALDSDIAELERLTPFIDAFCELEGVPPDTCYQLQVALEELVLNAINYGKCDPKEGAIQLTIRREGNEVRAVLSDSGIRFNPLEAPAPDLAADVRDRALGGLGIHLVRNFIPSIRYERRDGRNYLYLARSVNPEPGTV